MTLAVVLEHETCPPPGERHVEIVERKGLGHPDTICDLISERFSAALSRHYLERFGLVLHHNVDKALLSAGASQPEFGGGRIVKPIDLYLAGRATANVQGSPIPVPDIAREAALSWLKENLHAFDVAHGVSVHCLTQAGSADLTSLFVRQREGGLFLANDTSIGAGYAPLSDLESVVLAAEKGLNHRQGKLEAPEAGEDVKVMGIRVGGKISLTIGCAFIGRHLADIGAYAAAKERLAARARVLAQKVTACEVEVRVNAADDLAAGHVYLTVGGTSGECGDDGETGRGNRGNGLITPFRAMTLEAIAGKNPITHVGKLYNVAACRVARALVSEVGGLKGATCVLVSEIGKRIDRPGLALVRLETHERGLPALMKRQAREIAEREILTIPELWRDFLSGRIEVA